MAKWQVLQAVHPQTRPSVAAFYEDFLDFFKYGNLALEDAAIAFCRWRGEEIEA
jgi:hypothetical protein